MAKSKATHNYIFVSDFHLAQGTDELGSIHPREDFVSDDEFKRFLEWLDKDSKSKGGVPYELVFGGDCFDFLPVQIEQMELAAKGEAIPGFDSEFVSMWQENTQAFDAAVTKDKALDEKYLLGLQEIMSVSRLAVIEKGHKVFFESLGSWVGQGNRLVLMRGNHDFELYWPRVQETLCQMIWRGYIGNQEQEIIDPEFKSRIDFRHSWFYCKPGLFYIEHGSQHEVACASINVLDPTMEYKSNKLLIPDLGSLVVTYLVAPFEDMVPSWENQGHISAFLATYAKQKPELLVRYLRNPKGLRAWWRVSGQVWKLIEEYKKNGASHQESGDYSSLSKAQINSYKESGKSQGLSKAQIKSYADLSGLPSELVEQIAKAPSMPPIFYQERAAWLFFSPRGRFLLLISLLILALLAIFIVWAYFTRFSPLLSEWLVVRLDSVSGQTGETIVLALKVVFIAAIIKYRDVLTRGIAKVVFGFIGAFVLKRATHSVAGKDFEANKYLSQAAEKVNKLFEDHYKKDKSMVPRYYIFGHDHHPSAQRIPNSDAIYFNTGSWLPSFAEGNRRLRGSGDTEFTFLRMHWQEEDLVAQLMRWNDGANTVTRQITDPLPPKIT